MLTTTVQVSDPRGRMLLLAAMLFMLVPMPAPAESGAPDLWQTLIEAGATAREHARYADAERLFLLAGHEA